MTRTVTKERVFKSWKKVLSPKYKQGRRAGGRVQRGRWIGRFPFPNKKIAKLRYSTIITLNPGANTTLVYNMWKLGSVYHPDATGTGHQPLGMDQYEALYNKYTVIGAKISMRWAGNPANGAAVTCGCMGLHIEDNNTISTTDSFKILETPGVRYKYITSNTESAVISKKLSFKKFYHTKSIVGQDDYTAAVSADPTKSPIAYTWFGGFGADNIQDTQFIINIDYIVCFTEPKDLAQSTI